MLSISTLQHPGFKFICRYWSLALILGALFLFATKTSFNIPLYIMALIGLYRAVTKKEILHAPETTFVAIIFCSLWIPMLLSLPDAYNFSHSFKTAVPYLRFLCAAIFIIDEVKTKNLYKPIFYGLVIIVSFWCLDAFYQFISGTNIFGQAPKFGSISGMFHSKGTLGHVLAIASPVCFELIRRNHTQHRSLWLLLMLIVVIVLLGSKRTAWIMFSSSLFFYCVFLFYIYKAKALKAALVVLPVIAIITSVLATQYQPLKKRVKSTQGLFSGSYELFDKATARRLPIWETGLTMFQHHWFNGIGPRGFRYAYEDYADADNFFINNGRTGQTHPHMTALEIAVETGTIGLIFYLLFWVSIFKLTLRLLKSRQEEQIPWLMCIIIAALPYNTGLAFYGSYWSSILWWFILVGSCFIFSKELESENKSQ